MVRIISSLVLLFCTSLALAAPIKVESDISDISNQVNSLMSDINSLSDTNPNLLQALVRSLSSPPHIMLTAFSVRLFTLPLESSDRLYNLQPQTQR